VVAGLARYPDLAIDIAQLDHLIATDRLGVRPIPCSCSILASSLALDGRITSSPTAMRSRTFFELLH
jgi:hypothetical protein